MQWRYGAQQEKNCELAQVKRNKLSSMKYDVKKEILRLKEQLQLVKRSVQGAEREAEMLNRINAAGIINVSSDDKTHKLYVQNRDEQSEFMLSKETSLSTARGKKELINIVSI